MTPVQAWLGDVEAAARGCDDAVGRWAIYGRASAEAEAAVGRLADLRARVAAELHVDGYSYARIAAELGVSRSRAQQLVERGAEVG